MPVYSLATLIALAIAFVAAASNSDHLELAGQRLAQGRSVWLANCEGCHGYGIAGAPIPMQSSDWTKRLAKGKAVLYKHAINGFFGPEDTLMPERGGNPDLTDEEIMAAVDYMVALATYYIQLERK